MSSGSSSATPDAAFRLLVDSVVDYAIFLLDPEGNVTSWNAGAQRIKGWRSDEIIGQHFSRFYPPEAAQTRDWESELEVARREGRAEREGWRVRKDGTRFWANVVVTALKEPDGRLVGFAKVTRDLTDRAFRAFVETTNAIMWSTDGDGRPNADSPTWCAFTGQSRDEWMGLHGWDPVHPDDQGVLRVVWPRAKEERRLFEAEFRLRRHDGVYVWMACRAVPFLTEDGRVREWFGVTFDVSARKRAEQERDRAIERWSTTLESIGDGVVTTDAQGRIDFLNPVAEEYLRRKLGEVRGKPLTEIFTIVNEETRETVENPVDRVLREGNVVGLANHTVLVRPDGTDLPIDDSAAPIRTADGELHGVVLVFRDVSAQKREQARRAFLARAGEALVASTDYRESLAVVAQLAVPRLADWCSVDILELGAAAPEQLAVAHADPAKIAFARELGRRYPPDPNAKTGVPQVIRTGRPELYAQLSPDLLEAAAVDDEHRRIIRELKLRSAMVVPLRGRGRVFGAMTFIYADSSRLYDEDDLAFAEELASRAGLVIERRKLEEERAALLERERAARQDAEAANRAKDEFLATVSHELRTPLNAILGWASILQTKGVPKEIEHALTVIERNARAQARLVEDLLDMSRILSGKLRLEVRQTDVALAIADAIEAVRLAADAKGVALAASVEADVGTIVADPERLQQIVWNLLSNAVKFTPKGGHVELSASRDPSRVTIVVRDDGKGMPPEVLPTVFEPFRQADASATRKYGGLGLGLSIVKQLVQAHGGSIRADSQGEGQGASFTVELPVRAQVLKQGDRHRPPPIDRAAPVRLDGLRVLVVDDEPDALDLLRESLTDLGAQVETASNAAEAFEKLRATRPDVLVSDIGMPGEDGLSLMRRVRALPTTHGGRTQALALTAYASDEDALRAFAAGFQLHVGKPVDPEALGAAIASLAGGPREPS